MIKHRIFLFFLVLLWVWPCPVSASQKTKLLEVLKPNAVSEKDEASINMLFSISELKRNLNQRIKEKKALLEKSTSETEKEGLQSEISKLDEQLSDAQADFERIATGVDIGMFLGKKEESFDWKEEVMALVEPGIKEIKRMTVSARNKTKLKDELAYYENLVFVSRDAVRNISGLIAKTEDREVKKDLESLLPEWKGIEKQIQNKLQIANMQLKEMSSDEKSLIESSGISIKKFFRTRGLYLMIALISCICAILLLRLGARSLIKLIPGYNLKYKPFHIRLFEILARMAAMFVVLFVLVLVFYIFEDWVLLSLSIILFIGIGWAAKHTLPRFWQQSQLMLNIGAVREGERIIYQGVPWMVKTINIFCILENPDMEVSIRLPIEELLGKTSRPFHKSESWFPCRRNDWVILSDGTWGHVTSMSHEMVQLVLAGGSKKTYQTLDFLGQAPLNISLGFSLKVVFGVSYDIQKDITGKVLEILSAHIRGAIEKEGYDKGLVNVQVDFLAAGSSSLDLAILAEFKGEMAPQYYKLSRAIQRWCVDACTANNWEIPFPQLMVHH
ncbi:MAG: hypothetical protein M0T82_19610 [Desulfobacteraceae bacterium]|nr:hypothetical protein [Desulfobacteraceae bacterium]